MVARSGSAAEGTATLRAVVREFGLPDAIHVELARDVGKSAEERDEIPRGIEKRNKEKDKRRSRSRRRRAATRHSDATEALAWTDRTMTRLGLTLNRSKTRVCDARRERFDFLGYSFGPHCLRQTGRWFTGASPSKQSVQRLKDRMSAMLVPGNMGTWDEVRGALNRRQVADARHPAYSDGRGIRPDGRAASAYVPQPERHVVSLPRSQSESRMREIRTSGLMSGEGNGPRCGTAPLLDSTAQ